MFFYPAVLQRNSGCFSTIWLVATKGIKVPRRDYLKVNVISTCDDIMDYVLERVPPPQPGLPRPRFSLYLTSQLQYGLIVVFHRQCAILLDEIQSIVSQLLKKRSSKETDMKDSRNLLLLPDALLMMEEAEGAPDPLFGVMELMPSPRALLMNRENTRELHEFHTPITLELENASLIASQESITMRELQPLVLPPPEFEGAELDDHYPDTLDILMAQTDNFPEEELVMPREEQTPGVAESALQSEEERLKPTTVSSKDTNFLTPILSPAVRPPQAAKKRPSSLQDSFPPGGTTTTSRRRRRKQLIFFDSETQLSEEVQKQRINNPRIETTAPHYPPPSSFRMPSAADLFDNPCTGVAGSEGDSLTAVLPEEILILWRQAAKIRPIPGSDLHHGERGIESTDSEEQELVEVVEKEEKRLLPEEIPKRTPELEMLDISGHSSLPLESSVQREGLGEICPSDKEAPTVLPALQDIPESAGEIPEQILPESPGLLPELPEQKVVAFQSLFPADVDRRTVSRTFHRLLGNLSSLKLQAVQDEPFADIIVFLPRSH